MGKRMRIRRPTMGVERLHGWGRLTCVPCAGAQALAKNPAARPTAQQLHGHAWLQGRSAEPWLGEPYIHHATHSASQAGSGAALFRAPLPAIADHLRPALAPSTPPQQGAPALLH